MEYRRPPNEKAQLPRLVRALRCFFAFWLLAFVSGRHGAGQAAAQQPSADSKSFTYNFGGNAYGYEYAPTGVPGAHSKLELYALSLLANVTRGPWTLNLDYRLRTNRLRPFFPGPTWLQQGYVGYKTDFGLIRAGSFYRRVGLVWDGSFYGNIEYFDGLMLDPEIGVDVSGSRPLSPHWGLNYSVQFFATDSGINGSLQGRDFVSQPGAHMHNEWTARVAPVWRPRNDISLTTGFSFANGTIRRPGIPDNVRREWAADSTLDDHGWMVYGEVMDQTVSGPVSEPPQDATYLLFGARRARGRIQPRFNVSAGLYRHLNPRDEYILQPGVTIPLGDGVSAMAEYNFWRETAVPNPHTLDRSINLILWYHF